MKNHRHILIRTGVLALALLFLSGCRHRTAESEGELPDAPGDSVALADTVPEDTVPSRIAFAGPDEMLEYMERSPSADRYSAGILPQMVRTAPEYAEELLNNTHPRFVIADKGSMRVIVYDSCGVELKSFRMACGKNYGTKHKRRDSRTPEGLFSVEGIYDSTEWLFTDDDGNTSQVKGQYGPRFIRLAIPTTSQIGIHGTCAPWSVGGRRSHGCMRLSNDDIMTLVSMVEKGMPVIVNPSLRDQKVNLQEDSPVRRVFTGYPDRDEVKSAAAASPTRDSVATTEVPTAVEESVRVSDHEIPGHEATGHEEESSTHHSANGEKSVGETAHPKEE